MNLGKVARKMAGVFIDLNEQTDDAGTSTPKPEVTEKPSADRTTLSQSPAVPDIPWKVPGSTSSVRESVSANSNRSDALLTGEMVDFNSIYQRGGILAVPYTAEQFLEMLSSLPSNLPRDTRRQMAVASLNAVAKAIGTTPDTIVSDARRKLAVLNTYVDDLSHETDKMVAATKKEIQTLQMHIEEKQKVINAVQTKKSHMIHLCATNSEKLQTVLEFFEVDSKPGSK